MDLLSMTWRDMLFAHWPLSPAAVEGRLPDGLGVDARDGRAWVGVVAHRMSIAPRGSPVRRRFVEVNLRTYVERGDRTGVYFFSLDAGDRLAVTVARRLWDLPYYRAESRIRSIGDRLSVHSTRTHPGAPSSRFVARYGPERGAELPGEGSLAAFVTDRYRFFTPTAVGLLTARLHRNPLPVAPASADVEVNTVFEAAGFDPPEGDPYLLYAGADGVEVGAGPPALAR